MTTWKTVKLSDLGEIVSGATPATSREDFYNGDIPWLTPKDLAGYTGRYICRGERNITQAGLRSCSTKLLPKNTVLFSSRAPIGYTAIAENDICTNQGFKSIVPNAHVSPLFLYYLLRYYKDEIEAMASGTTFKEVSGSTMRNIKVKVPVSLEDQDRIAGILDSLDAKIELNQRINDNLEQQAEALFRAWFINFQPFGSYAPSDWQTRTLGESAEMGAGGDKPRTISFTKTEECPYPIYSNGLVDEGLYGFTDIPKITEESVTVSARGTIGFVCLRHVPYVPIVRLITLIPDTKRISAKYLYLYLKQLHISGTGTTQQQLTIPDFRKTKILIPEKAIMDCFTEAITPLFNTIWCNKNQNEKLAMMRDALLPKLLSGKIDVSNILL